jgi:hypothetical protein
LESAATNLVIGLPSLSYTVVEKPVGDTSILDISGAVARIPLNKPTPAQPPMTASESIHIKIALKKVIATIFPILVDLDTRLRCLLRAPLRP